MNILDTINKIGKYTAITGGVIAAAGCVQKVIADSYDDNSIGGSLTASYKRDQASQTIDYGVGLAVAGAAVWGGCNAIDHFTGGATPSDNFGDTSWL